MTTFFYHGAIGTDDTFCVVLIDRYRAKQCDVAFIELKVILRMFGAKITCVSHESKNHGHGESVLSNKLFV